MTLTPAARIPEDRVAEILARAAELDRDRRETITVDAIRTAALDAGITPSAMDAALAEYAARQDALVPPEEPVEESTPRFSRTRRFFRKMGRSLKTPLKLAGIFFVVGLSGAAGEAAVFMGGLAWLLLAGRLIFEHRPGRKASPYVLRLVFMTVALGLGFAAGEVDDDAIAALFSVAAPLLVLGSLIIKVRMPRRLRSSSRELEAPAS